MAGESRTLINSLGDVQLTEKAASKAKELSGGQKQRLSIAIGLVNDPLVLFLDEPTTGLDPQARRNLWELVKLIKAKGKTVVLTTHYMDEAEVLCDRIAIMDHAKIIALDTTDQLLAKAQVGSRIEFTAHYRDCRRSLFRGSGGAEVGIRAGGRNVYRGHLRRCRPRSMRLFALWRAPARCGWRGSTSAACLPARRCLSQTDRSPAS